MPNLTSRMRPAFIAGLLILLAGCFASTYAQGPVVKKSKLKKLLISNFYMSFHHNDGRPANIALIQQIGAEDGFTVSIMQNKSDLTPAAFSGVDVYVMNNTTNTAALTASEAAALRGYIEGGGKVFALHAVPDPTPLKWLEDQVFYAKYVPHSLITNADVIIDPEAKKGGVTHPIMEKMDTFDPRKDRFNWKEEWFNWTADSNPRGKPNVTILLTTDEKSYDCACANTGDHPIMWVNENIGTGKGKFLYVGTGHGVEIQAYKDKGLKQLWRNSLSWLGGIYYEGCMDANFVEFNALATVSNNTCVTPKATAFRALGPKEFTGLAVDTDLNEVYVGLKGAYTLRIWNVTGNKIFEARGQNRQEFKVEAIKQPGVYFVRVETPKTVVTKTFKKLNVNF